MVQAAQMLNLEIFLELPKDQQENALSALQSHSGKTIYQSRMNRIFGTATEISKMLNGLIQSIK